MKKNKLLVVALFAFILSINGNVALAGPWEDFIAELPAGPFNLDSCVYGGYGVASYLDIEIYNDGILDGEYGAWCLDLYQAIYCVDDYGAILGDLFIPGDNPTYDMLNWILNHYMDYVGQPSNNGTGPLYTIGDVQAAIWLTTVGMPAYQRPDPDYVGGVDINPWSKWAWGLSNWGDWVDHDGLNDADVDAGGIYGGLGGLDNYDADEYNADVARAMEIYDDAYIFGPGYIPNCDDGVLGLIVLPFESQEIIGVQPLLITIPMPCLAGCTPGFWKNNWDKKGGNAWVGYAGTQLFDTVFGVDVTLRGKGKTTYPNATLVQALDANGGEINALARHATATLLNMSSDCGDDWWFPYENTAALIADVKAAVDAAIAGDGGAAIQDLHVKLAEYNELGCPINQKGECMD